MTDEEFLAEYTRLAHAVQSGVAYTLAGHADEGQHLGAASPKHLRVGVDLRAVDHGALADLLIDKGVISLDAYHEALLKGLRQEIARYETALSQRYGTKVTLG